MHFAVWLFCSCLCPGLGMWSLPCPSPQWLPGVKAGCYTHSFPSHPGFLLGSPLLPDGSWLPPPKARSPLLSLSFTFAFQLQFKYSTHSKAKLKPAHSSREMEGRAEGTDPLLTYCPDVPGEDEGPGNHTQLAVSFCSSSSSQPEQASLAPTRSQEPVCSESQPLSRLQRG